MSVAERQQDVDVLANPLAEAQVCVSVGNVHIPLGMDSYSHMLSVREKEVASISQDFKWRCLVGMVSGCVILG